MPLFVCLFVHVLVDAFSRLVQVLVECFTGFVEGHRQERRMVVGCLRFCLMIGGLFELLVESNLDLVDKFSSLSSSQ